MASLVSDNNVKVKISTESDTSELKKTQAALKDFGDEGENTSNKSALLSNSMKIAATSILAIGTALGAATVAGIKGAASFEQTRIGLENMLGSADAARTVLKEVSQFAADTPFEFPELADSVKQLVAFGFSGGDALTTMKQLGDVSAAIGAPIGDLSYLMGTLKTQGRAFTVDIRQFAQRGVPIYEYLAKVMHSTTGEVGDMIEAGKIGFPEVSKAFELMTAEGGKFHGAMAKQSKSLAGLYSTLKDNVGLALREMVGITQEGDVKAGSLFDKLRIGAGDLIDVVGRINWSQVASDIMGFAGSIKEVYNQVANYLGPKLADLVRVFKEQIMPTLLDLWHNIIEPLIPVLGVALVASIGLTIDALKLMLQGIGWVIQAFKDGNPIVWILAAAFGGLAAAMAFNAVFDAITVGFATLTLVTIPSVMASIGAMQAAILAPLVMPAIAVGAAVAAIWLVINAANAATDAVNNAKIAASNLSASNKIAKANLQNLLKSGTPEQKARAQKALDSGIYDGYATGTNSASPGWHWVGENGPELMNFGGGEKVMPAQQSAQMSQSTNSVTNAFYGGVHLGDASAVTAFFNKIDQDTINTSRGLTINRGLR